MLLLLLVALQLPEFIPNVLLLFYSSVPLPYGRQLKSIFVMTIFHFVILVLIHPHYSHNPTSQKPVDSALRSSTEEPALTRRGAKSTDSSRCNNIELFYCYCICLKDAKNPSLLPISGA